jgi:hypothetical protein
MWRHSAAAPRPSMVHMHADDTGCGHRPHTPAHGAKARLQVTGPSRCDAVHGAREGPVPMCAMAHRGGGGERQPLPAASIIMMHLLHPGLGKGVLQLEVNPYNQDPLQHGTASCPTCCIRPCLCSQPYKGACLYALHQPQPPAQPWAACTCVHVRSKAHSMLGVPCIHS